MNESLQERLDLIARVEYNIEEGRLERALQLARTDELLPDPDALLVTLLARLNTAEREMHEALISTEALKIERAKITKRLLQFLKELKARITKEKENVEEIPFHPEGAPQVPDFGGKPVILILYAKEDVGVLEDFKKHLVVSLRDQTLRFLDVHADVPLAVTDTQGYQERLVDAARIVLGLVTPNALLDPVFPLAERALAAGKLIPILVEETDTEDTPFRSDIKGLPNDGRFVSQWPNANSAWVDVAKTLKSFFARLKEEA